MTDIAADYPINPNREIPTFNLSDFFNDKALFAERLVKAFMEFGFVAFTDHGVSQDIIDANYEAAKKFFALPEEVKAKYADGMGGQRGYTAFGVEGAKDDKKTGGDLKEFWHRGRDLPKDDPAADKYRDTVPPNLYVEEVPEWEEAGLRMYMALNGAGDIIMSALALGLGLSEDYFEANMRYSDSLLRTLHYPPTEGMDPDTPAIRAGAHEDINAITLLVGSEQSGLQVLAKTQDGKGKEWIPIEAGKGQIVVNIGDMLQRLTNGVLPSTTHRVMNPEGPSRAFPRYSAPFFFHFNQDFLIDALESCVTPNNPRRWPPILEHDFLMVRLFEINLIKHLDERLWSELNPKDLARAREAGPPPPRV